MSAEGNESFQIQIRTGSISGPVVATSATITVVDTPATYSISQSATSVNEGSSVTFTVTTTNVVNGTIVYWATTGTTDANDFSDSTTSGSVTINSNSGSITRTLRNDLTTEGSQNFTLRIYAEASLTTLLATASAVTVNDTSLTPPTTPPPTSVPVPTYSINTLQTSVNEGNSANFLISTTNVPNGTVLYWTTDSVSGTVNASDFTDSIVQSSVTIDGNSGLITRTLRNDLTTEPTTESFRLRLRTSSFTGSIVATSDTVTVNDTSLTPPTTPPPTTPPPTTPPPTTAPPPTAPPPTAPPPVALPVLGASIGTGVTSFTLSATADPFAQLGFYGSGTRRVTFTRNDSAGGTANYELYWNGSPMTDSEFSNFLYTAGSSARTGTISSSGTVNFYFQSGRATVNQVGLRLTKAGATAATPTYSMFLSQVYTWSNWRSDNGYSAGVQNAAQNEVQPIYNAGFRNGRFIVYTGTAPDPKNWYGMNRLPDSGGAGYWAQAGIAGNWATLEYRKQILSSGVAAGGRDAQAIQNGNQTWVSGTGAGPLPNQGTP